MRPAAVRDACEPAEIKISRECPDHYRPSTALTVGAAVFSFAQQVIGNGVR